jgi:hypothetical protein
MHDWRQYKREQYDGIVDVTVSVIIANALEKVRFNAEAVDICHGGIGIIVDTPLEKGFVKLKGRVKSKEGTVMWNKRLDNNKYRVGIQFDYPSSVGDFCERNIPPTYETY